MAYEKYRKFVEDNLEFRDLLEQTAEESCELAQAALKFIRAAKMSNNPTPVTLEEADAMLLEEIGDVLNCLHLLGHDVPVSDSLKWKRWAERLGYKETENAD